MPKLACAHASYRPLGGYGRGRVARIGLWSNALDTWSHLQCNSTIRSKQQARAHSRTTPVPFNPEESRGQGTRDRETPQGGAKQPEDHQNDADDRHGEVPEVAQARGGNQAV